MEQFLLKFLAIFCILPQIVNGRENITVVKCDTCDCYQRFSRYHSFCNSVNLDTCGPYTRSCMLEEDKQIIVDLHNKYRSEIATRRTNRYDRLQPPAANMMKMYWDEHLAKVAQKHADECEYDHDCSACRGDPRFTVGQNVCSIPLRGFPYWRLCMALWFNEIRLFKDSWIKPFFDGHAGHFTQMAWATSWKIGCGCRDYEGGQLLVCNYGPSGNVIGGEMYAEGRACSQCPWNTHCTNISTTSSVHRHPGLCVPDDKYGPPMPLPEVPSEILLWCNFTDATSDDCDYDLDPGSVQWTTERTYNRIYKTVTLNQGERTLLRFSKVLRILDDKVSFKFDFRKAPIKDGEDGDQLFLVNVEVYRYPDYGSEVIVYEDRTEWSPIKTSVHGWPALAHFSLEFQNNLPNPQFLQISNILISHI